MPSVLDLLDFEIPEVPHSFDRKETVLYALSVGLGHNPLDERQLKYVDPERDLIAVPSRAVVLGYPGFWLSDPATGVDPGAVLHGEQEIELRRPLPVAGSVLGKTRVSGIVDKGPGSAAVLYTEKDVTDLESGELLATTYSTTFLRGYGGFGGPAGPVRTPHQVPNEPPHRIVDLTTRPEQALLYRLNGDPNPLHSDPAVAARAGFARPILHGLCTFGVICHAIMRALTDYDATRLKSLKLRFTSPVYPGETIRTEMWPCGSFQARVLERDVIVARNGLATLH